MSPLLSIIITAHNGEAYLAATLDSVINAVGNALPECELIITNDSSGDNTQGIIDAFAIRYPATKTFVLQLANIGKVRNFAIAQCQGEYILMVDGDDLLLAENFSEKFQLLQQQRPDLLISKLIETEENSAPHEAKNTVAPEVLSQGNAIERFLIHRDFQAHVIGQFIQRKLLIAIPFPDFTCYEDSWVFPALLTQSEKIIYSRSGFYLYIKRNSSLSGQINLPKILCLYQTLDNMDRVLPARFSHLIACHWLDLFNRYSRKMTGTKELEKTRQRIRAIGKLAFLADSRIRFSYKRKLLKVAWLTR
ncbi:glycosyltransferase [Erwiniaceae bacterium BAC15a-03b]|uniref:Glycosyltransferase n=1 Tax=Winslowiella arboricola TaxID=2978220 RepID=A0A9J6PIK4_9GAMM|nr:glycosyltransferase [Winslowiella arboricola]MCU5773538.1 glycosyltransferase [Winslowiella arboricola]MCU5776550.1 glycosyltransferase [Winslowiella arboricola]